MGHPEDRRYESDCDDEVAHGPGGLDDIVEVVLLELLVGPSGQGFAGLLLQDVQEFFLYLVGIVLLVEFHQDLVGLGVEGVVIEEIPALLYGDEDGETVEVGKAGLVAPHDDEIRDDGGDVSVLLPEFPESEPYLLLGLHMTVPVLDAQVRLVQEHIADDDGRELVAPGDKVLVVTFLHIVLQGTDTRITSRVDTVDQRACGVPPSRACAYEPFCLYPWSGIFHAFLVLDVPDTGFNVRYHGISVLVPGRDDDV